MSAAGDGVWSMQGIEKRSDLIRYSNPIRSLRMVRVAGLEPTASCSQSRRATNCATPGYSIRKKSVCGQTCGQTLFLRRFRIRKKSPNRPCFKGFCPSANPQPGYSLGTPKPSGPLKKHYSTHIPILQAKFQRLALFCEIHQNHTVECFTFFVEFVIIEHHT